ncbi:MAG: DUF2892 domain-containing protein, partial [Actinomycetota bacterium]
AIRVVLGIVLLTYFAANYTTLTLAWNIVLFVIGLGFLLTGLIGYCPIYALLGIESFEFPGIHRVKKA